MSISIGGVAIWYFYPYLSSNPNLTISKPLNSFSGDDPYYYPRPVRPELIYSINTNNMINEEIVTILTLQGVLAKTIPSIYIYNDGSYGKWLDLIKSEGISVIDEINPWDLVTRFKDNITGYILWKAQPIETDDNTVDEIHIDESYNIAVSLCGALNACAVEATEEPEAIACGLSKVFDARGLSMEWLFQSENWVLFRHDLSFEVEHHSNRRHSLIDYAVFCKAPIWHAQSRQQRAEFLSYFEGDFPDFGWGAVPGGEDTLNTQVVEAGGFYIPSDWAMDLSVLSAIDVPCIQNIPSSFEFEEKVHYVMILMSDGDNLQWLLNDFIAEDWFGSEYRGDFAMTWQMSPAMANLCPIVLQYLYQNCTSKDGFVTGFSGHGLTYPLRNPCMGIHANRSEIILDQADIHYLTIQDFGWETEIFYNSTLCPSVRGIIYADYRDYDKFTRQVEWINDKPCIGMTYNFWKSANPADGAGNIAASINKASRDVNNSDAYSIINVHAWTHNMNDIATLVNSFSSDVRVVDPETFFYLLAANVAHENRRQLPSWELWYIIGASIITIGLVVYLLATKQKPIKS